MNIKEKIHHYEELKKIAYDAIKKGREDERSYS